MCSFFTSIAVAETLAESEWHEPILSWLETFPVIKIVWICLGVAGVIFIIPAAIKLHRNKQKSKYINNFFLIKDLKKNCISIRYNNHFYCTHQSYKRYHKL